MVRLDRLVGSRRAWWAALHARHAADARLASVVGASAVFADRGAACRTWTVDRARVAIGTDDDVIVAGSHAASPSRARSAVPNERNDDRLPPSLRSVATYIELVAFCGWSRRLPRSSTDRLLAAGGLRAGR